MTENELARIVIDAAVSVHKRLGPGLFESVYEAVLSFELDKRDLSVKRQVSLPLVWEGLLLEDSFRADLIVKDKLLIELKSIEKLLPIHKKQVVTYLRVSGLKLGLLLNFGAARLEFKKKFRVYQPTGAASS